VRCEFLHSDACWPATDDLQGDAMAAERCSEQVVVRIEPTLRRKLEDAASADKRSVGNLVRLALSRWLDEHDEQARSVA
jgi:hypothetical protein